MAIDRVNAVLIGRVKDAHNFPCELLEDPLTGERMLAYTPEVYWQRGEYLQQRQSMARKRAVAPGTPSHAWPGRPYKKEG